MGATEITQLMNHSELVSQLVKLSNNFKSSSNNGRTRKSRLKRCRNKSFSKVQTKLLGLQKVVQGANALSYAMANLDSQFAARFSMLGYASHTSYAERYAKWSKTAMDTTRKTLEAASYQNNSVEKETVLARQLQRDARTADG